jgi:hypothetical protein
MRSGQLIVFALLAGVAGSGWGANALAACDQALLQKLLGQGFSKDEILQLCGQPPAAAPAAQPGAAQATPPQPPPAAPAPPEALRYPAAMVGTWAGYMGESSVRLSLGADGGYRFYFTTPSGGSGVQVGKWYVDGPMFVMTPQGPIPGFTETHPFELDEAKTTLTISGAGGTMRLTRAG